MGRGCVALILFLVACSERPVEKGEPARGDWPGWTPSKRTQVVLLGTGTPNPDPDRSGPATAVLVDGVAYLVDCGPGIVRRCAAAARGFGIKGLRVKRLRFLFLTHLHSDHTVGLPDLVFSPWVLERREPLRIFGPEGTKAMAEHVVAAWTRDIRIRIDGLEPANTTGYKVVAREISPGVVYQDERVTVKAFLVDHGSWRQAFGFRFETPDRTIVVSGDTRPSENVVEASQGVDLLIHEVYSAERFKRRVPVWQAYHSAFHTSTHELARIAKEARPRLVVLHHQLFWGATENDLLREIATIYDGPVVSGRDLDRF